MSYEDAVAAYAGLEGMTLGIQPHLGGDDPILAQISELNVLTTKAFRAIGASLILGAFAELGVVVPRAEVVTPELDYDVETCAGIIAASEKAYILLEEVEGLAEINDKIEIVTLHGKHRMAHIWLRSVANLPVLRAAGYDMKDIRAVFGAEEVAKVAAPTGGSYL